MYFSSINSLIPCVFNKQYDVNKRGGVGGDSQCFNKQIKKGPCFNAFISAKNSLGVFSSKTLDLKVGRG